jgi:hypothetical protein
MISLTKVINSESFAANRWSYGQIIAVTVWGPVIVKLFDLLLCKSPDGLFLIELFADCICSWTTQERLEA